MAYPDDIWNVFNWPNIDAVIYHANHILTVLNEWMEMDSLKMNT